MNTFNIVNTNGVNAKYAFMVIATSYDNPMDQLSEIENKLGDFSGCLLFDLLASNGHASNRFIEIKVINGKFDITSFKVVSIIDAELKKETCKYFMNNEKALENSVLNTAARFLFKKGVKI